MRLGVGRIGMIEPDEVETKNLNRIYGAKRSDAQLAVPAIWGPWWRFAKSASTRLRRSPC
jgi:hypothetical protein